MKVKFVKLKEGAIVPSKATPGSAAYDVYIPEDFFVKPGRQIIPLGIAIEIPYGREGKIEARSGFSSKGMLDRDDVRRNADVITGKIDSDYRDGIGVIVKSDEEYPFTLSAGTRIAQLTFYKVESVRFKLVEKLSKTLRGLGGFGHTGK